MKKRYRVWIKVERPDGSTYRQLIYDEIEEQPPFLIIDRAKLDHKLGKGYHIVEFMGEVE